MLHTGAANSISVRASYPNRPGMLGRITSAIGEARGDVLAVDIATVAKGAISRNFTINTAGDQHAQEILAAINAIQDVTVENVTDSTFLLHRRGKIEIKSRRPVENRDDISKIYTPGVARVSMEIHKNPAAARELTSKGNTIAVVSDGSAVLGLGNIGPQAALPVMEGKALLFKKFADVDAWPIVLSTTNSDEIVEIVKAISPGFGGINLEDIAAPRCFYIEDRLRAELDIPVFHDDQHGTAVVVLAGLINALKVVDKEPADIKVAVVGAGAAGTACVKMFLKYGITNITVFDQQGGLARTREYPEGSEIKQQLAETTNPDNFSGTLSDGLQDADFFLGVAGPGVVSAQDLERMGKDAIVFALSNPTPEIMPEEVPSNVRIMATGRSDYPNQVNNSLAFPGIFRGVLDVGASDINNEMKVAAADAIAGAIPDEHISEDFIIPGMFDQAVFTSVAEAVAEAAKQSGVARLREEDSQSYAPNYSLS